MYYQDLGDKSIADPRARLEWSLKKHLLWDSPSGPAVKNPPANTGDIGLNLWSGQIRHATGHLSPHATITELSLYSLCSTMK